MKSYYEHAGITIYHADFREVIGIVRADVIITDPVWPNAVAEIPGKGEAFPLFEQLCERIPDTVKRMAVHLGCDSDPRVMLPVPSRLPFFRAAWLEYVRPHYKGRLLYGSDVAYLWGTPPAISPGQFVIPGKYLDTSTTGREVDHPCPRKLGHVRWLVRWWSESGETIFDPFGGGGTTARAARISAGRASSATCVKSIANGQRTD